MPFETGDCVALLRDTEIAALLRSERSERLEGCGVSVMIRPKVNSSRISRRAFPAPFYPAAQLRRLAKARALNL